MHVWMCRCLWHDSDLTPALPCHLPSRPTPGPNTNKCHFSIIMGGPFTYLDGHYVIFGEIISGWDVAYRINALARGQPDETAGPEAEVVISDSGQLRAGRKWVSPDDTYA